jgi:ABC-type lipoprotein export system ATPase subunit
MPVSFRLSDFTFRYAKRSEPALREISVEIPTNGVVGVLGMSGSGKTTLLNVLGLLAGQEVRAGSVAYGDDDLSDPASARADELRLREFGFVLQTSYLLPNFTCAYNVQMPLILRGCPPGQREEALDRLLDLLDVSQHDLKDLKDEFPSKLSGGERQRMAVLRAVIHDPQVVFADEPFASLDPHNTEKFIALLQQWRAGAFASSEEARARPRGLLLVTHEIEIALGISQHVLLLKHGRVAGEGLLPVGQLPGYPNDLRQAVAYVRRLIEPARIAARWDGASTAPPLPSLR